MTQNGTVRGGASRDVLWLVSTHPSGVANGIERGNLRFFLRSARVRISLSGLRLKCLVFTCFSRGSRYKITHDPFDGSGSSSPISSFRHKRRAFSEWNSKSSDASLASFEDLGPPARVMIALMPPG